MTFVLFEKRYIPPEKEQGEERESQPDGRAGYGECHADRPIAFRGKSPIQCRPFVINAPAVRLEEYRHWPRFQIGLGPLEESRKVLGMTPGHRRRLDELFGRICCSPRPNSSLAV